MIIALNRFNIYLLSVAACALLSGCHILGVPDDKHLATFGCTSKSSRNRWISARRFPSRGVANEIDGGQVAHPDGSQRVGAKVVDVPGGFDLRSSLIARAPGCWNPTRRQSPKAPVIFSMFIMSPGKAEPMAGGARSSTAASPTVCCRSPRMPAARRPRPSPRASTTSRRRTRRTQMVDPAARQVRSGRGRGASAVCRRAFAILAAVALSASAQTPFPVAHGQPRAVRAGRRGAILRRHHGQALDQRLFRLRPQRRLADARRTGHPVHGPGQSRRADGYGAVDGGRHGGLHQHAAVALKLRELHRHPAPRRRAWKSIRSTRIWSDRART